MLTFGQRIVVLTMKITEEKNYN